MSDTTICAAADELRRIMEQARDSGRAYAYTLGAVGQAAENALRDLDALLALRPADHARVRDAVLARVRDHLLDAKEAREALELALSERRAALGERPQTPEPHGARRTGGAS